VPTLKYTMPYAYALTRRKGEDTDFLRISRAEAAAQYVDLDADILSLQERGLLKAVDPKDLLCPSDKCRLVADDGRSLYRDDNHLSTAGAHFVGQVLEGCFDSL
jgi:hypothetical protein